MNFFRRLMAFIHRSERPAQANVFRPKVPALARDAGPAPGSMSTDTLAAEAVPPPARKDLAAGPVPTAILLAAARKGASAGSSPTLSQSQSSQPYSPASSSGRGKPAPAPAVPSPAAKAPRGRAPPPPASANAGPAAPAPPQVPLLPAPEPSAAPAPPAFWPRRPADPPSAKPAAEAQPASSSAAGIAAPPAGVEPLAAPSAQIPAPAVSTAPIPPPRTTRPAGPAGTRGAEPPARVREAERTAGPARAPVPLPRPWPSGQAEPPSPHQRHVAADEHNVPGNAVDILAPGTETKTEIGAKPEGSALAQVVSSTGRLAVEEPQQSRAVNANGGGRPAAAEVQPEARAVVQRKSTKFRKGASDSRETLVVTSEGGTVAKYQLGNCIGKGQFASVYRALNLQTGQVVAIKRAGLSGLNRKDVDDLMLEVDLLKSLSHPGIVKYEGCLCTSEYLYIILEFVENGSLHNTLKAFGSFPEPLVVSYTVKILEGLAYLHSKRVVHCDLKAANILTTKNGNVKLSDFGVSLNLQHADSASGSVVGTPYWMAPEVILLEGASTASDIWSLGCTIIELLTSRPPYADLIPMTALFHIAEDDCPPIPEHITDDCREFLLACFNKDPSKRPSAEKLKEFAWVKKAASVATRASSRDSIPRLVALAGAEHEGPYHTAEDERARNASAPELRLHVKENSSLSFSHGQILKSGSEEIKGEAKAGEVQLSQLRDAPRAAACDDPGVKQNEKHSFITTVFSKNVVCRVCCVPCKKKTMICEACALICHKHCTPSAGAVACRRQGTALASTSAAGLDDSSASSPALSSSAAPGGGIALDRGVAGDGGARSAANASGCCSPASSSGSGQKANKLRRKARPASANKSPSSPKPENGPKKQLIFGRLLSMQ